jgi:hypothetical protein
MSAAEKRIGPFEEYDPTRWSARDRGTNSREPLMIRVKQPASLVGSSNCTSNVEKIPVDLVESLRRQKENLRLAIELSDGARQFVAGRRADLAEVLRQDYVGLELAQ